MTQDAYASAGTIAAAVQAKTQSAVSVATFFADRYERLGKALNTHLFFSRDDLMREATEVDQRIARGEKLPLAGVPIAVKDNICVKGVPTTCASRILAGFRPPYDAHVVEKLRAAGAMIFGKTNCDEFAMGSSNENSAFGPTLNPWDESRVPGGSSGGSAAAVAAAICPAALGSDTGGSIRQPAAFCGVVGLKPTYGAVSRYGLVAYGSSLDQIGPLARNVTDAALIHDVISGHDPRDSTSERRNAMVTSDALSAPSKKPLKIGLVREFFGSGLDVGSRNAIEAAIEVLRRRGCEVTEVSLPYLEYSIAAYYIIAPAEASANLARYDGVRYGVRAHEPGQSLKHLYKGTRSKGFGREVKQRIMLGTFALSSGYYDAYYAKANRARALITSDFERAFASVDLLVAPTAPTTAFKLGEKTQDPIAMYLSDICTIAVNLAGLPAISVPCGFDGAGLPVGLQLIGPAFSEETLLRGAHLYEQAADWHEQLRPKR